MKKVLIVEDEIPYQKLLYDQLAAEGYDVMRASNGKKGLSLAKNQRPDLILLDVRMPVMDGMTMLIKLRKDDYGKSANVILLTNLEPNDDLLRKIAEGKPAYYLIKSDIQLFDLLEKVKKLILKNEKTMALL